MRSRVALLIGATILSFLGIEVAYRAWRSIQEPVEEPVADKVLVHRASAIPGLNYELNPGSTKTLWGKEVRINPQGRRDPHLVGPSRDGVRRIAVLGDSVAFGWGVDEHDMLTSVLERDLNATGGRDGSSYEVLNFAVSGYGTRDEATVLRTKALAVDPDFVIVVYVLNDPEIKSQDALSTRFRPRSWWEYSQVLGRASRIYRNFEFQRYGKGDYVRYLHHEGGSDWRSVVEAFEDIGEASRSKSLEVLVVILPMAFVGEDRMDAYPYRDLHARVADAAKAAKLRVLDLEPVYSRLDIRPSSVQLPDDGHPNPAGHRLIGESLGAWMREHESQIFESRKSESK